MVITSYNEELRQGTVVYIMFLIPSVILLYRGIKIGRLTGVARRYNTIFAHDRDGIVTVRELSEQTGQDEKKIFAELEQCNRQIMMWSDRRCRTLSLFSLLGRKCARYIFA